MMLLCDHDSSSGSSSSEEDDLELLMLDLMEKPKRILGQSSKFSLLASVGVWRQPLK